MTTTVPTLGAVGVRAVQARTLGVLMSTQVLGGVGVASGIAVGSLVAAQITGRDGLSGLASTSQVLGAALITVPMAALMAARGRRPGLALGYLLGTLGALLAITATVRGNFALLLLGTALFGGATTANSQARYAAVDLAEPRLRGRQLSLVVWTTTIGSVLGPNLLGVGDVVGRHLGIPGLAGPWVLSAAGFVVAGLAIWILLRPDPLLLARTLAEHESVDHLAHAKRSMVAGLGTIRRTPAALLGTLAVTAGHAVMVALMVMTPIHMKHGHAEIEVIGFVISIHILGMYGLSPLVGYLTDKWGGVTVIRLGVGILVVACGLAGVSQDGWSWLLLAGLFLLGLGWSCTMVAGSNLIAGAVPASDRASVQGASDLVMGLTAALAGALAGVVVQYFSYGWLGLAGAIVAVGLGGYTLLKGPSTG